MVEDGLAIFKDLGPLGVLALFIYGITRIVLKGMEIFKDNVLPIVTNHIKHMEDAFEHQAKAFEDSTSAQRAQSAILKLMVEAVNRMTDHMKTHEE